MKAWVGFMSRDIPNPTCAERDPQEHTLAADASFTYHTVSLTESQGSQKHSVSQGI